MNISRVSETEYNKNTGKNISFSFKDIAKNRPTAVCGIYQKM